MVSILVPSSVSQSADPAWPHEGHAIAVAKCARPKYEISDDMVSPA